MAQVKISADTYPNIWKAYCLQMLTFADKATSYVEVDDQEFTLEEINSADQALGLLSQTDFNIMACGQPDPNQPYMSLDEEEMTADICSRSKSLSLANAILCAVS